MVIAIDAPLPKLSCSLLRPRRICFADRFFVAVRRAGKRETEAFPLIESTQQRTHRADAVLA